MKPTIENYPIKIMMLGNMLKLFYFIYQRQDKLPVCVHWVCSSGDLHEFSITADGEGEIYYDNGFCSHSHLAAAFSELMLLHFGGEHAHGIADPAGDNVRLREVLFALTTSHEALTVEHAALKVLHHGGSDALKAMETLREENIRLKDSLRRLTDEHEEMTQSFMDANEALHATIAAHE